MVKKLLILMLMFGGGIMAISAQDDHVRVYFRTGCAHVDPDLKGNRPALEIISKRLRSADADTIHRIQKIELVGGASPEGGLAVNKRLSEQRAAAIFSWMLSHGSLTGAEVTTSATGSDWGGLITMVETDGNVPYRQETLALLRAIASAGKTDSKTAAFNLRQLKALRGGAPYRYMYRKLFPELRTSSLRLQYGIEAPTATPAAKELVQTVSRVDTVVVHDPVYVNKVCPPKPFYMALKTNMLYDALLLPNIEAEFYLCSRLSLAAGVTYGWWSNSSKHRYWRAYGADVALRYWLGTAAGRKPLSGHHVGIYGSMFTYDAEFGGKGYMGGKPGGNILNKFNYTAGVEYGYSLPVARRLNIDFTVGVGYWGGTYNEYQPKDDCNVWLSTKQRKWFGPTKAEVSLVWLLGHDNVNKKKGGAR